MKLYLFIGIIVFVIASPFFSNAGSPGGPERIIKLGKFTSQQLDELIRTASLIEDPGDRIGFLSEKFLGTQYEDHTLVGSNDTKEVLTVNLEGVDCFTLLDYVEAMRLSADYGQFVPNLVKTRYKSSKVAYVNRNHFFTDWYVNNSDRISDVTLKIGNSETAKSLKRLNRIDENSRYLPGIKIVDRDIEYIPSVNIDEQILSKIRTGDYLGIYSERPGLDVSHTGIAVRKSDRLYIRHASSSKGKREVVDEVLKDYIKDKPGLVILRVISK